MTRQEFLDLRPGDLIRTHPNGKTWRVTSLDEYLANREPPFLPVPEGTVYLEFPFGKEKNRDYWHRLWVRPNEAEKWERVAA